MDYSQHGNKRRKRSQNPHATRLRNKIAIIILRVMFALVLIGGFAGLGAGMGVYIGILNNAPELDMAGLGPVSSRQLSNETIGNMPGVNLSSFIVGQDGEERERLHGGHNTVFVSFEDIPQYMIDAIVAIEDERFFEHNGIDTRGIVRAMWVTTQPDRGPEGASTITQQLVKNMLGVMDNDFVTKLQEQHHAINFERYLVGEYARLGYADPHMEAKNFILQSYLNIINLGRQNYGVQSAAWFYYDMCVSELSIAQAATIAAITQNPSRFPPDIRPQDNWRRTQLVLRNMLRLGFISDDEYEEAREYRYLYDDKGEQLFDADGEPLTLGLVYDTIFRREDGRTRLLMSEFDCFTDALLDQVRDDLRREYNLTTDQANRRIFNTGLRIYSTQNMAMQAAADRAFLDESLWPNVGFSIEVTHYMTVYNSITQQRRHYQRERVVANMAEAEAFVQSLRDTLLTSADEIVDERTFTVPQPQGAFVLIDHHTGHVMAIRGIRGEKQGNRAFNRATQATRSPGSQMKPLVPFGPLFDLGVMQPASIIDDIPFALHNPHGRDWSPGNHWGSTYRGLTTARAAIYESGNVVSARAGADTTIVHAGVPTMHRFLENLGVSTLSPNDGAAMVLGGLSNGMKLIELAGAYAAIANAGEYNRPVLYTVVLDHEGQILLENGHAPQRAMRATTAYLLTHSMQDTVTRGTGTRANWTTGSGLRGRIPIAGKTGTSQRNRDLGFVGYTPYFTAAFWIGNDNEQPLHQRTREFHTPLWRNIMEEVHLNLPARSFERPPGITTGYACLDSGHAPTDLCRADPRGNRAARDIFASGHVPSQACRVHQQYTVCTESHMLAGHNCPEWAVVTRVGIVRPVPIDHITAFVRDRHVEFSLAVRQGLSCTYHGEGDYYAQNPNDDLLFNTDTGEWINSPNFNNTNTGATQTPAPTPMPETGWGGLDAPASTPTPNTTPPPFMNIVTPPGLY
jgi:penicillin-binding protein 1A